MPKYLPTRIAYEYEEKLRAVLESISAETRDLIEVSIEPSGQANADRGDEAVESASIEPGLGVIALADEQRRAVEAALVRIRDGTYGACASCGEAIPRARLDLVPWASECAACAGARERSARRSGRTGS